MKTSCDCSDKPQYSTLELANRIDKCVDIVSRQEDTIDAQEKTIDVEIEDAEQNILDAIDELSQKIGPIIHIKPIHSPAIDALFESTYIVKRVPNLDEQYKQCVWAYVYDSINMGLDDDLDWENVDLNCLFFSDTDAIENHDVVLNQDDAQFSIEGYKGDYVKDLVTNQLIFRGELLRIVRIIE